MSEVDGASFFTDKSKNYEWARMWILDGYELKALWLTNDNMLQDWEGVWRQIEESIPPTPIQKGC